MVHGPLNLIGILDLWRDVVHSGRGDVLPESITYRATSPVYVEEEYRIVLKGGDVRVVKGGGGDDVLVMKAEIR